MRIDLNPFQCSPFPWVCDFVENQCGATFIGSGERETIRAHHLASIHWPIGGTNQADDPMEKVRRRMRANVALLVLAPEIAEVLAELLQFIGERMQEISERYDSDTLVRFCRMLEQGQKLLHYPRTATVPNVISERDFKATMKY